MDKKRDEGRKEGRKAGGKDDQGMKTRKERRKGDTKERKWTKLLNEYFR